jgi:hypothetical protein
MVDTLADELLDQAKVLLTLPPNQANLRRAVSTAYFSVFHLLIRATVSMWSYSPQRARLGRLFEHKRMKEISGATLTKVGQIGDFGGFQSANDAQREALRTVARNFINLQQARHRADYDLHKPLDAAQASLLVDEANAAFESWRIAQDSEHARDYLFSLLFKVTEKDRGEERGTP